LKALLLVGGKATRLHPLSLTRPKCLFPLAGKPIIDHILEGLSDAGVTEAILAVNNLADKIEEYLGPEKYGVKLGYNLEEEPLGTGGPIKLAEKHLQEDSFLVLNGDILSFIDYGELMDRHELEGCIASITLKQVEDPSRYGVVRFGERDRILEFIEKPEKDAPSNWINAGCYALSPEIFDYIPPNRKVSIEREVYPGLAVQNQLLGYRYTGKWIDIGIPADYLKADQMLSREPTVGKNTVVGKKTKINNSIIWDHTRIGNHTVIENTVIGSNCTIGNNVRVTDSVLADNVKIDDHLIIRRGTKIWPDIHLEKSITEEYCEITKKP
jgi:mannose-1-phosphate guanylyltransferase